MVITTTFTQTTNNPFVVFPIKFRFPTCLDDRANVYETQGDYTIYHLALENEDYFSNYGIYANGLLVETASKYDLEQRVF